MAVSHAPLDRALKQFSHHTWHGDSFGDNARKFIQFESPRDLKRAADFDAAPDTPNLKLIREAVAAIATNHPQYEVRSTSGFAFQSGGHVQLYLHFDGIVGGSRGFYPVQVFDMDRVAEWLPTERRRIKADGERLAADRVYRSSWRYGFDQFMWQSDIPPGAVIIAILLILVVFGGAALYELYQCGAVGCYFQRDTAHYTNVYPLS